MGSLQGKAGLQKKWYHAEWNEEKVEESEYETHGTSECSRANTVEGPPRL